MAKIAITDSSKYSSGGIYFSLKDDRDTAQVQFLADSSEELNVYAVHDVKVNGVDLIVDCLRRPEDPRDVCPLCQSGNAAKIMVYTLLIHEGHIKVWVRGKKIYEKLDSKFKKVKNPSTYMFEIERLGAKGDQTTEYEIDRLDKIEGVECLQDIIDKMSDEQFETYNTILQKVITTWNYDECLKYLETGNDPKQKSEVRPRRASQSTKPVDTQPPVRRRAVESGNDGPEENVPEVEDRRERRRRDEEDDSTETIAVKKRESAKRDDDIDEEEGY